MKRFVCLDSDVVGITLGRLYAITEGEVVDDVGNNREWKHLIFLRGRGAYLTVPLSVEVDV